MEYKKMKNDIYVRIDPAEEILETIEKICAKENIVTGHFQGIGACDMVVLSTYSPQTRAFQEHRFCGMFDIASLMGNITQAQHGEISLHAHAVFSYLNENNQLATIAGHLRQAVVNYTGEIIISPASETIGHRSDIIPTIYVWKF